MTIQALLYPTGKSQWRYLRDLLQYLNHPTLMCSECATPKAERQCAECTVREEMETIVKQAMSPWTAEFSGRNRNKNAKVAKVLGFFWSGMFRYPKESKNPIWILECSHCGKRAALSVVNWNGQPIDWTCPGCGKGVVLTGTEEYQEKMN